MNVERLTKCGYQFSLLNVLQGLTRYTEIDEILNQLAAYEDTGLSPADIATLTARAEAAEAERDAAVEDLKRFSACCQCNANIDGSCCDMFDGTAENKYFCSNWQWRGPQAGRE